MKLTDVQKLVDMGPRERAAHMLDLGSELHRGWERRLRG